ncbi:uncharacterized protein LOC125004572 isoform X2 [Mugil cephalus]|uniref:uncharacterized protein LOC125004572 isoform X2 n=1 Tax=Mugil cephalus TaxID=48193 RepID=UPI001FB57677|nr:uncharacterized protein LOC125004572 isoform X2 [Mugil cephalus]
MDGLWIILIALSGVVSSSHGWISVPTLEVTVRPGDNVTLYCDCRPSRGEYIVWFRNCSHEYQPTLVLDSKGEKLWSSAGLILRPRFDLVKNNYTDSYGLLITNVTDSDEGLYYCATEKTKVEDKEYNTRRHIYTYGNITTKLILDSSEPQGDVHDTLEDCSLCWKLLFSLCPSVAILSSMFILQLCRETAKRLQVDEKRTDTRVQIPPIQDEDVFHAALELHQATQRPKRMKIWSSDITACTYSVVRTSDLMM